jgi:hypothetical protein
LSLAALQLSLTRKSHLHFIRHGLTGNLDPMEGNPLWKYIQNSVSSQVPKQLPRKVSFSKDVFFDVSEDATHKLMVTPDGYSVFYIRKWAPVWPKDADLTPDFGYGS